MPGVYLFLQLSFAIQKINQYHFDLEGGWKKEKVVKVPHSPLPKVTLKVINQDRMFFADFSVNCQPIFMKFCNNHISTES